MTDEAATAVGTEDGWKGKGQAAAVAGEECEWSGGASVQLLLVALSRSIVG